MTVTMVSKCIHYIEFGVHNGLKYVQKFISQYKFHLACTRTTPCAKQWLVCSREVRFLITELSKDISAISHDPYLHSWAFTPGMASMPPRDSVFNVALRVKDIEGLVCRLHKLHVQFVKPLQTLSDEAGLVRVCSVKSCVGNVVHTLVEDNEYSGLFLPGFAASNDCDQISIHKNVQNSISSSASSSDLHHIDHVAYCVPRGSSASVISWYEKCFGMKRFFINREEEEEDGFVISGEDLGLRLKAFEYWKCAESGVSTQDKALGSLKFVVVEPLPDQGANQLDTFLDNHGGAGVQHVGLHTEDIVDAVSQLQGSGVQFNEAPYTYYTEIGKLQEIIALGMDVALLQRNGILIDTEYDDDDGKSSKEVPLHQSGSIRYLLQKFTRPLFDSDTFFLEVIQRVGATGFGSGNITALWRSLQAYLREKEAKHFNEQSHKL